MTTSELIMFIWPLILCGVIFTIYRPSISGPFIFDDLSILSSWHVQDYLNRRHPAMHWVKDFLNRGHYSRLLTGRILTYLTYQMDVRRGLDTRHWHRTSLWIHTFSSMTVYFLLLGWFHRTGPSMVGSLIFAVHPLAVMAVGYISGRSSLLCGWMVLMTLLSIQSHLYPAAVLFSILALLSKEEGVMAVVFAGAMIWLT